MKKTLMDTAIRMWQEQGFDAVPITEICKTCGVTKGSFYHHFPSKEGLLLAYFEDCGAATLPGAIQKSAAETSYIQKIWILTREYTKMAVHLGAPLVKALIRADVDHQSAPFPQKEGPSSNEQFYQLIMTFCEMGQKAGEIRSDYSAETLIETVTSTLTGILFFWSIAEHRFDLLERQYQTLYLLLKT